jgi:hypothetical protein
MTIAILILCLLQSFTYNAKQVEAA